MARKCTVCEHPKRKQIDSALAIDGASYRTVSNRFGLTQSALKRHVANGHITPAVLNEKQVLAIQEKSNFERNHQERLDDLIEQKALARAEGNRKLELDITLALIKLHDIDGKASGVYREKVEMSGKDGGPLAVIQAMSDEEVIRRANAVIRRKGPAD